jgi:hypothetical protein
MHIYLFREESEVNMPFRTSCLLLGFCFALAGCAEAPTSTIRDVLGRPARGFDEWVRDHRAMLA